MLVIQACIFLLTNSWLQLLQITSVETDDAFTHTLFSVLRLSVLTIRVLATLQPRVPAPSRRHLVLITLSRSKDGTNLHLISFRFRSTDDSASLKTGVSWILKWYHIKSIHEMEKNSVLLDLKLVLSTKYKLIVTAHSYCWQYQIQLIYSFGLYLLGSMHSLRFTILGPIAPFGFFSHPTLFGHTGNNTWRDVITI